MASNTAGLDSSVLPNHKESASMSQQMDEYTKQHLEQWLEATVHEDYIDSTREGILEVLRDDPGLLEDHGWSELRDLADLRILKPSAARRTQLG